LKPKLFHRDDFGKFLTELGLTGEGVEVGSAFGAFAEIIADQWRGRLHLVDPWCKQEPAEYREITNHITDWSLWYDQMLTKIHRFGDRVVPHRMFSKEGATLFRDGVLDFVYLDGNHSLEAVTEDLNFWVPKVKSGGLVSGHDYEDCSIEGKWCFVKSAVDKWTADHKIELFICEGGCSSWYFFKP